MRISRAGPSRLRPAELGGADRSITPDIFFMWSPDRRLQIKLNDWSRPAKLAIPLLIDDEDELSLITFFGTTSMPETSST